MKARREGLLVGRSVGMREPCPCFVTLDVDIVLVVFERVRAGGPHDEGTDRSDWVLVPCSCCLLPLCAPRGDWQPKAPPQPSLQFTREQEAKLTRRKPVCYFCKSDKDDPDSPEGAFIRVSDTGTGIAPMRVFFRGVL